MKKVRILRFGRLPAVFLLLAAQFALGVSVHRHSSSVFESIDQEESASPRKVHEVACSQPTASHWHRDRVVETEPCLACLRRHLVGIQIHAPIRSLLTTVETLRATATPCPSVGFQVTPSSRGPPGLL